MAAREQTFTDAHGIRATGWAAHWLAERATLKQADAWHAEQAQAVLAGLLKTGAAEVRAR